MFSRSRASRLAASVAAGLGISLLVSAVRSALARHAEIDFHVFFESALAWRGGTDLYTTAAEFPNLNPPQFIVAFAPLTLLSERAALAVLIALNVTCALAAAVIIWRSLRWKASFLSITTAIAAAGLTTGLQFGLEEGHPIGVLALCFTVGWAAARGNQLAVAGVAIGLLASIKPFFACILIVAIVRRQWKTVLWAVVAGAGALVAGVILAGPESFVRWLETGQQVSWFNHPLNASLAGLAARAQVGAFVWCVAALGLCVASAVATRKAENLDDEWLVWGLASLLISPLGWVYYVPLLAGPICAVAARRPVILLGVVGLVWPIPLVMTLAPVNSLTAPTVFSLSTWSLLTIWCISAGAAVKAARHAGALGYPQGRTDAFLRQ